jgi:hypothetical protein
MSFDLQQFNIQLSSFGTVQYSQEIIISDYVCLEFVCVDIDVNYTLSNISNLMVSDVLPYFPLLQNLSIDTNRIKGALKRAT